MLSKLLKMQKIVRNSRKMSQNVEKCAKPQILTILLLPL